MPVATQVEDSAAWLMLIRATLAAVVGAPKATAETQPATAKALAQTHVERYLRVPASVTSRTHIRTHFEGSAGDGERVAGAGDGDDSIEKTCASVEL